MSEKNTCAIILAAGTSSRMGHLKQLLPLGGKSILKHVIDTALSENFSAVYTVTGHESGRVQSELDVLDQRHHWVTNDDYLDGQSTSLKKVFQHIHPDFDNAMIFLGDMPFITSETAALIHSEGTDLYLQHDGPFMVRPKYDGKIGHPVFIGNINDNLIEQLEGDAGFRTLKNIFTAERFVDVEDEGANFDIDTRDQYKEALKRLENGI